MIFGRRIFISMRSNYSSSGSSDYSKFKSRYSHFMLLSILGSSLLFYFPALYFFHQSYLILYELSRDSLPSLSEHLNREHTWIFVFSLLSVVILGCTSYILTSILIKRVTTPIEGLERHMGELARGKWNIPPFTAPFTDFQELLSTYDHLHRKLKTMNEEDLKLLSQIVVDPHYRYSQVSLLEIINHKRRKLAIPEINLKELQERHSKEVHETPRSKAS